MFYKTHTQQTLAPGQQLKYWKMVLNMFKFRTHLTPFSRISIAEFEKVSLCWTRISILHMEYLTLITIPSQYFYLFRINNGMETSNQQRKHQDNV